MCAKLKLVYSDDHNLERFLDYTPLIPKCFPTLKSSETIFLRESKKTIIKNIKTANAFLSKRNKTLRHYI